LAVLPDSIVDLQLKLGVRQGFTLSNIQRSALQNAVVGRHRYAAMINSTSVACHAFIPLPRCEIVLPEEARAHESSFPALAPTQSRNHR
jgi:hypothetical protein